MYTMAWRMRVRIVGVTGEATVQDEDLIDVQEYATNANTWNADAGMANSFHGERTATTTGVTVTRVLQSLLKKNLRFEIWGKPVGTAEQGAPDLTGEQKTERLYVRGDTPNLALVLAIRKANKSATAGADAFGRPDFAPIDNVPEVLEGDVANP